MKQISNKSLLFVFVLLALAVAANSLVFAQARAPLVVGDGTAGSCTEAALDAALTTAAGNAEADVITFTCGTEPVTITFTTTKNIGVIGTPDTLTINGGELITFDGGFTGTVNTGRRLFHIRDASTVNFIGLTFANGNGTNGLGGNGAAILAYGNANVTRSTFTGNYAGRGAAIAAFKDTAATPPQTNTPIVNVFQSAFINNTNTDRGVLLADNGVINVANSTFSGNTITSTGDNNEGAVIRVSGAQNSAANFTNVTIVDPADSQSPFSAGGNKPLNIRNSIIVSEDPLCPATNTTNPTDASGNVVFGTTTLCGLTPASTTNPNLAALSTGFVPFFDLGVGSSALGLVTNDAYVADNALFSGTVTVDQNNVARPIGTGKDSGSVESASALVTATATPTSTPTETPTPTPTEGTPIPVPGAFNLISPANGAVIRDTADVTAITWGLSAGATSYEFVLTKTSDNVRLGEVIRVTVQAADCGTTPGVCTLTVGADVQALLTDGTYSWTVTAANTFGTTEASNSPFTFTVNTAATELVLNGGFENLDASGKPVLAPWTLKNGSGDKVKCNKDNGKVFAYTGECAFRFKGVAGDKAKLTQNIDPSLAASGDLLTLSAAVDSNVAASKLITLKVEYTDPTAGLNGDGKDKAVIEVTGPTLNDDYEVFSVNLTLDGVPTEIKVQLKGKAQSGKTYVDDISVAAQPLVGSIAPSDALLPLP